VTDTRFEVQHQAKVNTIAAVTDLWLSGCFIVDVHTALESITLSRVSDLQTGYGLDNWVYWPYTHHSEPQVIRALAIYLSICLSIYLSIYLWLYSRLLDLGSFSVS
jgi:hypothetical protein